MFIILYDTELREKKYNNMHEFSRTNKGADT